jgi:Fur family transcriptional regulator, ferric uptake regulator
LPSIITRLISANDMTPATSGSEDFRPYWRKLLHRCQLKCTPQRIAVLDALSKAGSAITHRELAERLASFGWEQSTLFRTLNRLCAAGIAQRIDLGDHVWRFELTPKLAGKESHAHFCCRVCGTVLCLQASKETAPPTWSRTSDGQPIEIDQVLFRGRCGDCLAQQT